MAELLILEFEDADNSDYEKVNAELGIDMATGEGDWPEGIVSHSAGVADNRLVVVEVWESREDQDRFMKSRLAPALQKGGLTKPPTRVHWSKLAAHHTPRKTARA